MNFQLSAKFIAPSREWARSSKSLSSSPFLSPLSHESENRSSSATESQFENESKIETASQSESESVDVVVIVVRNI